MVEPDGNYEKDELDRILQELSSLRTERERLDKAVEQLEQRKQDEENRLPSLPTPVSPGHSIPGSNLVNAVRSFFNSERVPELLNQSRQNCLQLRQAAETVEKGLTGMISFLDQVKGGSRESAARNVYAGGGSRLLANLPRDAILEVLRSPQFQQLLVSLIANLTGNRKITSP